jgi:hypothetical protein
MVTNMRLPFSVLARVAGASLVLWSGAAVAACTAAKNDWDESFGRVLMGGDAKSDRSRMLKPCGPSDQCSHIDDTGIEYSDGEKGTVIIKWLDLDRNSAAAVPLGLARGASPDQVKAKLFPTPDLIDTTMRSDDGTVLVSGLCFANSRGVTYSVVISFAPDGKLSGIGMTTEEEFNRSKKLRQMGQ